MTPHLEASPPAYVPRDPSQTLLYQVVADHLETFLASLDADPDAKGFPAYMQIYYYLLPGRAAGLSCTNHAPSKLLNLNTIWERQLEHPSGVVPHTPSLNPFRKANTIPLSSECSPSSCTTNSHGLRSKAL